MPTEARILVLKSDGSTSNQDPSTIRSVTKRTATARFIDDDDSDEELGDLIWKSSRTAKAVADAKKAAASTSTENCEHSASQKPSSVSSCHSSIPDESGVISKDDDLGQKHGARQKSAFQTKRTFPVEEVDDPAPPKRSCRPPCSHDGCPNKAQSRGVCGRHGGRLTCKREGCTNQAMKGGVCGRHGAKHKSCSHDGCTNIVVKGGVCTKHGAKQTRKTCSEEGCTNFSQKEGVCWRHGANRNHRTCSHEGCTSFARKGGACRRHGCK